MERKSYSHRVVFGALIASLVVALVAAMVIYERFIKTRPIAASHLPANTEYVVRLDVEQVVAYEPFRVHLLQAFEQGRREKEPRVKHLERKTTVELGIDSRELVFAELPEDQWLILLGGVFRRDEVLTGAARLLQDEGEKAWIVGDLLVHENGKAFAIAEDGTFILGSSATVVTAAIPAAPLEPADLRARIQEEGSIVGFFRRISEQSVVVGALHPGKNFRGQTVNLSTSSLAAAGQLPNEKSLSYKGLPLFFEPPQAGAWELTRAEYDQEVARLADRLISIVFSPAQ